MEDNDRLTMYEACLYHSRADRALRLVVGKCLEKFRITMMEWLLLGVVGDGPDNGMNMSSLSKNLDVTMPQVTALTSHLLQQKMVKQKAAKHDRRNRYVVITTKGKALLEEVEEELREVMNNWLQPIPAGQLRDYMQVVQKIGYLDQDSPPKINDLEPIMTHDENNIISVQVAGEEV